MVNNGTEEGKLIKTENPHLIWQYRVYFSERPDARAQPTGAVFQYYISLQQQIQTK